MMQLIPLTGTSLLARPDQCAGMLSESLLVMGWSTGCMFCAIRTTMETSHHHYMPHVAAQ